MSEVGNGITCKNGHISAEQVFLPRILSEILNEWLEDIFASVEFALYVFKILRSAIEVVGSVPRGKSDLPTGHAAVDVL